MKISHVCTPSTGCCAGNDDVLKVVDVNVACLFTVKPPFVNSKTVKHLLYNKVTL